MSQLKLSGDASGTGIVTVAAPNTNSTYTVTLPAAAGTIVTGAAGSDTQVQFNDGGSTFGGDAGLTYNKTTDVLTVAGSVSVNGITAGRGAGSISTNTAFGASALAANTTGASNVAVGYQALDANTTGRRNVAVGQDALGACTTGQENTALGFGALGNSQTASNNVGIGSGALQLTTTGADNTALGTGALFANTTGANNTALGRSALLSNETGASNTAVGYGALDANTTGARNTAVGVDALGANTTAEGNTVIGYLAGASITTGNGNVFLGRDSGYDTVATTTGTRNVIVGAFSRCSAADGNDQIVLGYNITSQGNSYVTIGSSSGKIYNAFTVNATWTQTSDGTMKNIVGPDTLGLSFINRLNPIKFTWKPQNELPVDHPYYREVNGKDTTTVIHGFVAQEVKAALDAEGCTTFNGWDQGNDGIQAISREMFISPLVKAVQELSAQVQALQAEIATLKAS